MPRVLAMAIQKPEDFTVNFGHSCVTTYWMERRDRIKARSGPGAAA